MQEAYEERIERDYKGYKIYYDEGHNDWRYDSPTGGFCTFESFADAKAKIDEIVGEGYRPVPAYYYPKQAGGFREVTVLRPVSSTGRYLYNHDGEVRQSHHVYLFAKNPENEARIKEALRLKEEKIVMENHYQMRIENIGPEERDH